MSYNPLQSEITRFRGAASLLGGVPAGVTGPMPVPGSLNFGTNVMFTGEGTGAAAQVASDFDFGTPPSIQNHEIDLETIPIQCTYLCPPGGPDADMRYAMPEMPAFSINFFDQYEGSTPVVTLAKLNQYLHDAYNDFERASSPNSADSYQQAETFRRYLETYGERGLEIVHQTRNNASLSAWYEKHATDWSKMLEFYSMATQDLFCWQTKFGILSKVNYLGPLIGVGRDVSLEAENNTFGMDHYAMLNVALAKRCAMGNIFGGLDKVTVSVVLWFVLTRKRVIKNGKAEFAEFVVLPFGDKKEQCPMLGMMSYTDMSGRACFGHRFNVGKVMAPGKRNPNPVAMQNAANTGLTCNERLAYEDHGALPTLQIMAGFK